MNAGFTNDNDDIYLLDVYKSPPASLQHQNHQPFLSPDYHITHNISKKKYQADLKKYL